MSYNPGGTSYRPQDQNPNKEYSNQLSFLLLYILFPSSLLSFRITINQSNRLTNIFD